MATAPDQNSGLICPVREGLRDRNDLDFPTGGADDIANGLADQKSCHRSNEGNGTGLGIGFILTNDMIFLHAPIVAPEGHRAAKGNSLG